MNTGIVQSESIILRQPVLGLCQMATRHCQTVQHNLREGQCVDILHLPTDSNEHLGAREHHYGDRPHVPLYSLGAHPSVSESSNGPAKVAIHSF